MKELFNELVKHKKYKKVIKYMLVAFVIALFIDFEYCFIADNICSKDDRPRKVITNEDVTLTNAEFGADGVISCNLDPQISITGVNCYVKKIELLFSDMNSVSMPVQYYLFGDSGELVYASPVYYCSARSKSVFLKVESDVVNIRIDVGFDSSDSYRLDKIVINPSAKDVFLVAIADVSWQRIIILTLIIVTILFLIKDHKAFCAFAFRYRWLIGALLVCAGTLLKIHGSSIGVLGSRLSGVDIDRIWGSNRAIRSDEYAVFTQMALSQFKSGFALDSGIWGYSDTDMFLVYGQPVKSLVALYRPFSLGYMFLGAERGLAFYWCSRNVILFLVSFEFGRFLTNNSRKFSVCYATLVAVSPVVQWWFSINELVEMLIFGQGIVILLYCFLRENKVLLKLLYACGMVICAGGYILALYPAWEIPLFYVFLACLVALLVERRKEIKLCKADAFILIACVAVLAISFIYIVDRSSDALQAILNTSYPGKRRNISGPLSNLFNLFKGWSSYLWTLIPIENPCEEVCFISFFPIGAILSAIAIFREKRKDAWIISLSIINIFLILYYAFGVPGVYGKLTLLNYTVDERFGLAIGLVNLMLFIRVINVASLENKFWKVLIIFTIVLAPISLWGVIDQIPPETEVVVFMITAMAVLLIAFIKNRIVADCFILFTMIISIIGGALVNPVCVGMKGVYNAKVIRKIEEINNNDPGLWIVNNDVTLSNIPTIVGAKCINALSTYPDRALWDDLGYGDQEEIWNRYAHKYVYISDQDSISLLHKDLVRIDVSVEKLKKIGVRYIFSVSGLEGIDGLSKLYDYNGYSIWEVK